MNINFIRFVHMRVAFCTIFLSSLLFSCGVLNPGNNITEAMKSWVGHHKSKLIQEWGPPNNISTDGKGGEVYTYYYNRNKNSTTTYNQYTKSYNTSNNSYTAERHFYINKDGKIYSWRWKGW